MRFDELPRDSDGLVLGQYVLRHQDRDFSHAIVGVTFERGETTAPVSGQDAARLLAALGNDVEAFPYGAEQVEACATPTTWSELEALEEDRLREIAAELGATDRRWKAQRLRSFIADELGIEEAA